MSDTLAIDFALDEQADETQSDGRARKRRRSLRKGTHSCWACKRRKEKCSFDDGDICTGCLRRGTKCVSQRFADSDADAAQATAATATATRLQRIEDMVAQLTAQIQRRSQMCVPTEASPSPAPRPSPSQQAPASTMPSISSPVAPTRSPRPTRVQVLYQDLYESLPCPQDIQLLRQASARLPVLSTIHISTSYATLRRDGVQSTDGVLPAPPLVLEPVLMAKYMLQIAVFLQEMPSIRYPELACLVEPATELMDRCANTAINLVTRQDDLLGSIESLEAIILESIYQCNSGRLRLSWMAAQRAILLAQTMGVHLIAGNISSHAQDSLHVLDPGGTRVDLSHVWFRIVHYNLQLSRMLGLPPGGADVAKKNNILSPYDPAADTPESYLEQVYSHVMISTLKQRSSDPGLPDVKGTQALDQELQRAANAVPNRWWLPPNLAESSKTPINLFWDIRRLLTQMLHHDLRAQLNVPCMLARDEAYRQRSEMARIACVHSSREVLSRFIILRDFNQTVFSCRFANFLSLMAAITLVLAHLGGSRTHSQNHDSITSQVDSLLSHHAPSDRAMMEQALETMDNMSHSSGDRLCEQSAHVLRRLLDIQARNQLNLTGDSTYVSVQPQHDNEPATAAAPNAASEQGERLFIPYFGAMRIVRPNNHDSTRKMTTALDPGAETDVGYQAHDALDLVDPLDVRDEQWMSQTIDMTFLDALLEGAT